MPRHPSDPVAPVPFGDATSHSSAFTETAGATIQPLTGETIELNFGPPHASDSASEPVPESASESVSNPASEQMPLEQAPSGQTPPEPEPIPTATATAAPAATPFIDPAVLLAEAESQLAEAEARAAEHYDAWLRAKAEIENVRRRGQEDTAKALKFAAEKFATAMLPVKDSLEAALAIEGQTLEKLREGVELTLKQIIAAFEGAQLAEENPLGKKFDPNKHQAIAALEAEAEPNTVIRVLQKGYLLHGRVIRPAMVMVAKAKA